MSLYLKDPGARIDYAIDWGESYLDGQIIANSEWRIDPDEEGGAIVEVSSFDLRRTAATVSGGLSGRLYRIGNRVTLSDGRCDERSLTVRVEER